MERGFCLIIDRSDLCTFVYFNANLFICSLIYLSISLVLGRRKAVWLILKSRPECSSYRWHYCPNFQSLSTPWIYCQLLWDDFFLKGEGDVLDNVTISLSLSLSLSHTHTHTQSVSLPRTHSLSNSLSFLDSQGYLSLCLSIWLFLSYYLPLSLTHAHSLSLSLSISRLLK